MESNIYDDTATEAMVKDRFGLSLDIKEVVVRSVPTSHTTQASVFVTKKNQVYALITGRAPMTLDDVRKIIRRMGMVADAYQAPKNEPNYFNRVAEDKFKAVFPGRRSTSESDLRFYRLLAPYNPALVRISEVSEGTIKQFDSTDSSSWRTAAKFAYRRINPKSKD
ncbi:hypothetical protein H7Y40_00370 [Pedobacter sp.]|nr:hypothetical protein [Candidatus Saccharibacteria bacterium]